jgi:hypothetical protein
MLLQQNTTMTRQVKAIWKPTKTHSQGNALTANLLKSIMPIEHTHQLDTPTTASEFLAPVISILSLAHLFPAPE